MAVCPPLDLEIPLNAYSVFAVRPETVTVWLVTKAVSSVVDVTTPVTTFRYSTLEVDGILVVQLSVIEFLVTPVIWKLLIVSVSSEGTQGFEACSGNA